MKKALIKELNNINKYDTHLTVVTTSLDNGGIGCSLEYNDRGVGLDFIDVRFVNEESIVNLILHAVSVSHLHSVDISVKQFDEGVVELRVSPIYTKVH